MLSSVRAMLCGVHMNEEKSFVDTLVDDGFKHSICPRCCLAMLPVLIPAEQLSLNQSFATQLGKKCEYV